MLLETLHSGISPVLSTVFEGMQLNLAVFKLSHTVLDAFVFLMWVKLLLVLQQDVRLEVYPRPAVLCHPRANCLMKNRVVLSA